MFHHPILILPALMMLGGGYYLSLVLWPYTYCRRCSGRGRNAGSSRRRFGHCGRCKGTGRRERLGTHLFLRKH